VLSIGRKTRNLDFFEHLEHFDEVLSAFVASGKCVGMMLPKKVDTELSCAEVVKHLEQFTITSFKARHDF